MTSNSKKVLDFLESLKIPVTIYHHEEIFTVAEAQRLRGKINGGHSKNLFLKDRKGKTFLVSALEEATIDLKSLHTRIDAKSRLSFGSHELLDEVLGIRPGAVSPLGLLNDLKHQCTLVLDKAFLDFELLNFHPLDNRITISISPDGLQRFLTATGHNAIYLDL